MNCKKCGSNNITMQSVSEQSKKGRGCAYWLFIGWWLEMILWIFLTLPRLLIALFMPKRTKTKNYTMAICQNCGRSWRV